MRTQTLWVDRGHAAELNTAAVGGDAIVSMAVSRTASIALANAAPSFWIVLRGAADVDCREGRFALTLGEWISLERDARPTVDASRGGLVLGLALPAAQAQLPPSVHTVYPGCGRATMRAARACLGLWRRAAGYARNELRSEAADPQRLKPVLRYLAALQADYAGLINRCPGRSLRRKRQVFARMQRAHLYLEGNLERPVRVSELAALCNVSIWYFTKTFHALYGEGPQAMAARLRLQRACELLHDTRLSVGEVGAACGFENNCSFSRAFRAHFGMPPSLYRIRGWALAPDCANAGDIDGKAAVAART